LALIERAGIETVPLKVTAATAARVEIKRIAAVCAAECNGQRVWLFGHGDQVCVTVHQAVSKNAQTGLGDVDGEQVKVGAAVGVGEEDPLTINAALRNVVCTADGNRAGKSCHLLV